MMIKTAQLTMNWPFLFGDCHGMDDLSILEKVATNELPERYEHAFTTDQETSNAAKFLPPTQLRCMQTEEKEGTTNVICHNMAIGRRLEMRNIEERGIKQGKKEEQTEGRSVSAH
jgi:hypothetical protein